MRLYGADSRARVQFTSTGPNDSTTNRICVASIATAVSTTIFTATNIAASASLTAIPDTKKSNSTDDRAGTATIYAIQYSCRCSTNSTQFSIYTNFRAAVGAATNDVAVGHGPDKAPFQLDHF
jgi:hypothetical protein